MTTTNSPSSGDPELRTFERHVRNHLVLLLVLSGFACVDDRNQQKARRGAAARVKLVERSQQHGVRSILVCSLSPNNTEFHGRIQGSAIDASLSTGDYANMGTKS